MTWTFSPGYKFQNFAVMMYTVSGSTVYVNQNVDAIPEIR